ncbi:DUF222 domain-containing protein, partial [Kribbella solani]|uniref:DUF222 domain-containing protein n=1 Tax=Kribbella solani TaxID=236067 RepID=UPI0029C0C7C8
MDKGFHPHTTLRQPRKKRRIEHMFENDLTELSTADLLESAAEHRALANHADTRLLEHAQTYADRYHPNHHQPRPSQPGHHPGRHSSNGPGNRPGNRPGNGRERTVTLGGDGCPEITEFAIAEFAAILAISPMTAARLIGEALALRHRFPHTWARVLSGDATAWKARQLATTCLKLTETAAHHVDRRVAPLIDTITPYRLDKIIHAAKHHADPDLAHTETDEKARERGVFIGPSNHHGTKTIYIKAAAGA